MSIQAVSWVITHSKAKLAARLVLISIANHADAHGGNAFPSIPTIAAEARMSERQAQRAIARLENIGELVVDRGAGRKGTNLYIIIGMGDNLSPVGVTFTTARGDKLGKKHVKNVTQTVREPSLEPETTGQAERANGKSNGKGSRLPEDWRPSAAGIGFAQSLGLDPGAVADEFADYWRAVPGGRGVKSDWEATFRNSCRKTAERAGSRYRGNGVGGEPPARPGTITHALNAILSRDDMERRGR